MLTTDVRSVASGTHAVTKTIQQERCPEAKLLAGSWMCPCHGLNKPPRKKVTRGWTLEQREQRALQVQERRLKNKLSAWDGATYEDCP